MAGYSGTPLPQKLGIKPGHRVALLGAPEGFARLLAPLPAGVTLEPTLAGKPEEDQRDSRKIHRVENPGLGI